MEQTVINLRRRQRRSLAVFARQQFDLYRVAVGRFFTALLDWA